MEQSTKFNIVVLGAMNPRIHHPQWYRDAALIDNAQYSVAMDDSALVCTKDLAQFSTDRYAIRCRADRWMVETDDSARLDELEALAGTLFDEKLPHTPLDRIGFNFEYSKSVTGVSVSECLGSSFPGADLGLPDLAPDIVRYALEKKSGQRVLRVFIEPESQSSESLHMGLNYEYHIIEEGLFKIAPMLQRTFQAAAGEAGEYVEHLISALTAAAKGAK